MFIDVDFIECIVVVYECFSGWCLECWWIVLLMVVYWLLELVELVDELCYLLDMFVGVFDGLVLVEV